jgi:pyridoxal phosphate enzyme (YggS family)
VHGYRSVHAANFALIFKAEWYILDVRFSMISENIRAVQHRIAAACKRSGRTPSDVTLLAVSKTFSEDEIRQAVDAGLIDIGENYVQELLRKRDRLHDPNIRWHFIGHLQSNKVKYIADWIYLIHAVDSISLAEELNKRAAVIGRIVDVLVEVNTTGESSKFGVRPEDTLDFVRKLAPLHGVRISGLMTIGAFLPDPEQSRPMFRLLRQLRDNTAALGQRNVTMRHLSMGMTGDVEVAIEEGATIVRIGTAIFGARVRQH